MYFFPFHMFMFDSLVQLLLPTVKFNGVLQVRNKQCLQCGGRSLSLSHENRASLCQQLFDWLISGHQSINPSREAIFILSGKFKRFTFVHPVIHIMLTDSL